MTACKVYRMFSFIKSGSSNRVGDPMHKWHGKYDGHGTSGRSTDARRLACQRAERTGALVVAGGAARPSLRRSSFGVAADGWLVLAAAWEALRASSQAATSMLHAASGAADARAAASARACCSVPGLSFYLKGRMHATLVCQHELSQQKLGGLWLRYRQVGRSEATCLHRAKKSSEQKSCCLQIMAVCCTHTSQPSMAMPHSVLIFMAVRRPCMCNMRMGPHQLEARALPVSAPGTLQARRSAHAPAAKHTCILRVQAMDGYWADRHMQMPTNFCIALLE